MCADAHHRHQVLSPAVRNLLQGMGFVLDVDAECVGLPSKGTQEAARQDTGGIALLVIESLLARGRGDVEVRDSGGRGIHMRGIMG